MTHGLAFFLRRIEAPPDSASWRLCGTRVYLPISVPIRHTFLRFRGCPIKLCQVVNWNRKRPRVSAALRQEREHKEAQAANVLEASRYRETPKGEEEALRLGLAAIRRARTRDGN